MWQTWSRRGGRGLGTGPWLDWTLHWASGWSSCAREVVVGQEGEAGELEVAVGPGPDHVRSVAFCLAGLTWSPS